MKQSAEEFLDLQQRITPKDEFSITKVMVDFTKIHVKNCKEEIRWNYSNPDKSIGQAILDCYPLTNIK